jgi:tRNA modification GTPase
MQQRDTIAAIATAAGRGGVGIVRLSGPQAKGIAEAVCGATLRPRNAHYARFRGRNDETIDDGIALWFRAPASYTGEDVVELQAHGSPVVLHELLETCCAHGARRARAGEFSERAWENGRLDLAQAEAVADLIASGSEAAARAAQRSLDGEFSARVHALAERVVRLRVWIEAAIDFPEEEIDFLAAPELAAEVDATHADLHALLRAARRGVRLADGLHVVIVGRPNVGKSSLLNALAASERAIVTDVAGTTRDVLRETIDLDGVALTLVDTAGLREAADVVEREGIRRARGELERADLAVLVSDDEHARLDMDLLHAVPPRAARIVVHNKIDLAGARARREEHDGVAHLWLSARSRDGLDALVAELRRHAGAEDGDAGAFSARARHVAALERARAHIDAAVAALAERNAGELAAEDLRRAHDALGEITGEVSADDLLGEIFSSFCIGK